MEIFLLRHAIAAERDPARWSDDSHRPLTDRGRRRMKEIAKGMKRLGLKFDAVLSSPYTRARETAEIAADRLDFEIIYTDNLTPEGSFERLVSEIVNMQPPPSRLLLVGHEPDLSGLACHLLTGQAGGWLVMKKAGLCKMEVDHLDVIRPRARLEWLLTPVQLQRLA